MESAEEFYYHLPEEEGKEDADSSRIGPYGHMSNMVGLSDQYIELKQELISQDTRFKVFALVGMPGIGKTTFAKKIFEDPDAVVHFNRRVWVTVGRKCQLEEIPQRVLAQANPDMSDQMLAKLRDEDIARYWKDSFKDERYLIVLDDVWDKHMMYHLQIPCKKRKKKKNPFPDGVNGSRVLLTTRLQQKPPYSRQFLFGVLNMRLLNNEESWDLLRAVVFAQESCPSQLEKAGRKIAEYCDGLPLTIVTVADLLSQAEKTPQCWSEVAAQKNHQLFMTAYDEISKVLLPSYEYLPRLLQMCFLYMGVFPQNYEIPRSKLFNMWNADGLLQLEVDEFPSPSAIHCLRELVSNNLVMMHQCTIESASFMEGLKRIKTCGLHSSLWHLSNKEADKIKFCHVLNSRNDGLGKTIEKQCRLSFHNNILFGIKEVHKSVETNCASTALSLLCYGPYHQYQVPMCFGLGLLRILDALTIRFYEFPKEVLQLVELRYLALTLNGKLPSSIAQLSNLQFLIVGQHLSIKSCRDPSYLPMEIWNMKQLQHLEVMGSNLPDPCGASLKSLLILSNISAHSCTESVLKAIPNLKKLGIQIELAPGDDGKLLSCFDHIFHLKRLESLKCVILNPEVFHPPVSLSISSNLRKLTLSGLGYPWKEMSKIASLPNLKVLKLRNYAFRGPKWVVQENGFSSLHTLVIEDTDLVEWEIGHESFLELWYLSIKHCYKLEKIHGKGRLFGSIKIELVDCNPSGVKEMKNVTWSKVGAHSSWNDGKVKR